MPADGTTLPFKKRDLGTSRWQLGLNATPDLRADGRGQPDVLLQSLTAVHGTRVISLLRSNLVASVVKRTSITVEARIEPHNIDQIRVGQNAVLRFSTFNQRTTPEINGEVIRISADITSDQAKGTSFYTVRIMLPDSEIARLKGLKLVPGMPLETFIQTGDRTAISYLIKPVSDQLMKAWRER